MSASREKKTRQNMTDEISEKKLKAQQDAAKAKRSTVINTVIGVVVAVLVVALLVWNSGVFQPSVDAVKVGDKTYSTEDLQYYYQENRLNQIYMGYYGIDTGFDANVPADEQIYDQESGQTWHDYFVEEAAHTLSEIKVLAAAAKAEGFKLSDEGKQSVKEQMDSLPLASANNGFSTVNSYLKAMYGDGMDKGKLEDILTEGTLASEYSAAYSEALEYTDEELEAYYTEHKDEMDLIEYAHAFVKGVAAETEAEDEAEDEAETEETEAEQTKDQAKEKADQLAAELKKGVAFDEAAAALAEDETVTNNGVTEEYASYVDGALAEWLLGERKAGEVSVIEAEDGWHVVQFLGRDRDNEQPADIRHILVAAEQDEGAQMPTDAQFDAAKAEAEALLKQWEEGEKTEESFAALAKAESADPGSAENGGLYEGVSSASGFIPEFTDWALDPERQEGDTGIVKNTGSSTKGWHIMYFAGKDEPVWKLDARHVLSSEATEEWIHALVEEAGVEVLEGASAVGQ